MDLNRSNGFEQTKLERTPVKFSPVGSPLLRRYAWGVVCPCLLICTVGLFLLRNHELAEAELASQHLVDSVGQDLEAEVRSLSGQAITGSRSRLSGLKSKVELPGLRFYAPEDLHKDSGPTVSFLPQNSDGTRESDSFRELRDGSPGFFFQSQRQRGIDWIVEISLANWVKKLSVALRPGTPIFIALVPLNQYEAPVVLFDHIRPEVNRIELQKLIQESSRTGSVSDGLSLGGANYVMREHKIPRIGILNPKKESDYWSKLIVLVPHAYIYRQWWSSFWLVIVALAIVTLVGPVLVLGSLRRQFLGLQQTIDELRGLGKVQADRSLLANEGPYLAAIADEFRGMSRALSEQQLRARTMNRVISELAECSDQRTIITRAVELIGTQCRAEITVFVPVVGSSGIIWQNHKLFEIDLGELTNLINTKPNNQRLTFQIRPGPSSLGFVTAIFAEPMSEIIESLTHLVFGQIDNALNRLSALERTSDEKSKSNLLAHLNEVESYQLTTQTSSGAVATYARSVDELPSGWIEWLEFDDRRVIVTLGNLRTETVLARLIAMTVRSSIRSLSRLVDGTDSELFCQISKIEALLETLLYDQFKIPKDRCEFIIATLDRKSSRLEVVSHEFPSPLIVSQSHEGNSVAVLECGLKAIGLNLPQNSSVIFYSDSINGAQNLRAGIFQRLLRRGLEQTTVPAGRAPQLRDEIAALWNYYVQQSSGNERVHILCLSAQSLESYYEAPGAGSAA